MTEIPCVGAVVLDAGGRILLVRRANPPAQGQWSIPGGRVEPGETHEAAVVRELLEETEVRAVVDREVGTVLRPAPGGGTYVIRDYLLIAPADALAVAGDDAADVAWVAPAELSQWDTSTGLVEALAEWGLI